MIQTTRVTELNFLTILTKKNAFQQWLHYVLHQFTSEYWYSSWFVQSFLQTHASTTFRAFIFFESFGLDLDITIYNKLQHMKTWNRYPYKNHNTPFCIITHNFISFNGITWQIKTYENTTQNIIIRNNTLQYMTTYQDISHYITTYHNTLLNAEIFQNRRQTKTYQNNTRKHIVTNHNITEHTEIYENVS